LSNGRSIVNGLPACTLRKRLGVVGEFYVRQPTTTAQYLFKS
jgi:hypothetical protein